MSTPKLTAAQREWLRHLAAMGPTRVPSRTASVLVRLGLASLYGVLTGRIDITPAGRAEVEK